MICLVHASTTIYVIELLEEEKWIKRSTEFKFRKCYQRKFGYNCKYFLKFAIQFKLYFYHNHMSL